MTAISVIIPAYGVSEYLEKCIVSVLNQSFQNFELIVVDDNNPDTEARRFTEELLSRYSAMDERIIYIKHDCNKNGAVARNTGFALAKGKYVSLLDSDDEYMPDRLKKCFDVMESVEESVAGVYTGCEFRRSGKKYFEYKDVRAGNYLKETLACRFMFCTGSNIFVRKSVIDELNGFDGNFLRHQDYEFLVRLFEKYSLASISEILVIKNNENFNLPDIQKLIAIKEQYLKKYDYILKKLSAKDVDYVMHSNYIGIAENAMAENNFRIANEYYAKARKYGGLSTREVVKRMAYPVYSLLKKR